MFLISDKIVDLKVTNYWELENPNYYPIQLVSLNVQAYHDKKLTEANNATSITGWLIVTLWWSKKLSADSQVNAVMRSKLGPQA